MLALDRVRILRLILPAWMVLAGCGQSIPRKEAVSTGPPPMARFVDALRKQDREAFLSFFSKTNPWSYVSTITDPPQVTKIDFAQLQSDFNNRKGWYESLFDAHGDDCFRDWVVDSDMSAWAERQPNRFVRQQVDGKDTVYVEWRKEGDLWVVAVIAEPSA